MRKLLLTKDGLRKDEISYYNSKTYYKTPTIDGIAKQGLALNNHYTTAPSTAMALTSIITGKYPYQLNRSRYQPEKQWLEDTIFKSFYEIGYCSKMFVPDYWNWFKDYINAFDKVELVYYNGNLIDGIDSIYKETLNSEETNFFYWIHLPHVLYPHVGFGSDIKYFDNIVKKFSESNIFDEIIITSDHGHFRFEKGLVLYGFDLYQDVINVPLISSKKYNYSNNRGITTHKNLFNFLLENKIVTEEVVIAETAYKKQINRKMSIITEKYKLIYTLKKNFFEFYDLQLDRDENWNLMNIEINDKMRKKKTEVSKLLFYPYKEDILPAYRKLLGVMQLYWKKETTLSKFLIYTDSYFSRLLYLTRVFLKKLLSSILKIFLHN